MKATSCWVSDIKQEEINILFKMKLLKTVHHDVSSRLDSTPADSTCAWFCLQSFSLLYIPCKEQGRGVRVKYATAGGPSSWQTHAILSGFNDFLAGVKSFSLPPFYNFTVSTQLGYFCCNSMVDFSTSLLKLIFLSAYLRFTHYYLADFSSGGGACVYFIKTI